VNERATRCESCGMPIEMGPYCRHCTDEAGKLQPFEERFERMVQWRMRQEALDRRTAEARTREYMRGMPAWRGHPRLA
jgi:hypothetical protein